MWVFEISQGKREKGQKRESRAIPIYKGQAERDDYSTVKSKSSFLFKYGQAT